MAKPKAPTIPDVFVTYRELPGTRVGFWVVPACPYCASEHFHSAGAGSADPFDKLGEVQARCERGRYVLSLPPKRSSKKEKRAKNKRERRESQHGWNSSWDEAEE